jgi:DUF917 family protein
MVRDPVPVSYALEHGAPGAINMAINLGYRYLEENEGPDRVKAVTEFLGGEIICKGKIEETSSEVKDGFDVGLIKISTDLHPLEMTFLNEYMTLERNEVRIATFPDLMTTFDEFGRPVTSAELEEAQPIYLVKVPKENIPIGHGNRYAEVYEPIEAVLGKKMIGCLEDYLL